MRIVLLSCWLIGAVLSGQQADPNRIQELFQQGQEALVQSRYAEAAEAFEKIEELAPEIAEVQASLGFSYFQLGRFAQAASASRKALKLNPKLETVDILLAMSLVELGNYEEALPGLKKGFQKSPEPALKRSAGLRLQRAYTGLAQDDKAVETAVELVRLYPDDPEILFHAGRAAGNYAYLTMRTLADSAPESVWVRLAAGDAYESQGQYEFAIAEYRKVLELDPGRPGIHYRLGRALLALPERPDSRAEALREFEQELKVDPSNANAAYEAGEILSKEASFEKAREFFELALNHYPDFVEARIGLGKALFSLGKPARALPHLEKAIALNPDSEVAYYRLSQVHRALGNQPEQQEAIAEFQRLRRQQSPREKAVDEAFFPTEVTKQEVDPEDR